MELSGPEVCDEWSGSPPDAPELRLILVGNMGCGKTLSTDNLLAQSSSLRPQSTSRLCEVRRGMCEGRRLTVVETPRWYWSGQQLESSVQRETERALSLTAPGPHAFLILVPVGQFTEMEQRIPAQLERLFGEGVLAHALVLLTCGDYLFCRDKERYVREEEPQLTAMVDRCGGRWHVFNNRQPQDRQQVISLLEKVEDLAQSNGGCYLHSALQREVEARVREKERELERRYSFKEEALEMTHVSTQAQKPQNGGMRLFRSRSRDETEERVSVQQLPNGLHSQPPTGQEDSAGEHLQRCSSFKLTKEGALLSQLTENTEVKVNQHNQNFRNTIHHRISPLNELSSTSLPTTSSSSGFSSSSSTGPSSSSSSSTGQSSSSSSSSDLRLVLLGQTGSGKSTAGNALLGREEFKLGRNAMTGPAQQCVRGTTVIGPRQVTVVDTPDWFWSGCSPAELKAHLSSCLALCGPGPDAFLLCVPVTQPAHSVLGGLGALEAWLGPEAVLKHTLVLFTHSDLLEGGVEQYITAQRPEMLELVQKCGDRYHVLERGKRGGSVEELLEKLEQLVKESGGGYHASRERSKPRGGEERVDEVDRARLHSLKEEDENEEEDNKSVKTQEQATSASSRLGSVLRFVGGKLGEGAKRVPRLVAGGALLGGALGLFFGGPVGGAVGATAGSVAAEVGRRKYSKSKTD